MPDRVPPRRLHWKQVAVLFDLAEYMARSDPAEDVIYKFRKMLTSECFLIVPTRFRQETALKLPDSFLLWMTAKRDNQAPHF